MKRIVAIVLLCVVLAAPVVAAPSKSKAKKTETTITIPNKPANGPMGIGVFFVQPTGIDFQMDLSRTSWADFKAAWNLAGGNNGFSILLQGNYEYAFPGMIVIESASFTLFVELGLDLYLFPTLTPGGSGGLGVRYRF